MYDHIQHGGRKHFCRYCLEAFSTKEILKCHINDCFKINGKKRIDMLIKSKFFRNALVFPNPKPEMIKIQ